MKSWRRQDPLPDFLLLFRQTPLALCRPTEMKWNHRDSWNCFLRDEYTLNGVEKDFSGSHATAQLTRSGSSQANTSLCARGCWFDCRKRGTLLLTLSLPQPVKCPGWKMHGRACKQYIFWSYNRSTFNAMCSDENLSNMYAGAIKKTKRVWNVAFLWVFFKMTPWQWRG